MNGRVYDPAIGRFLSPDPYVQDPDNSQSFNRYSYVFNNPLSFTDPSGFTATQLEEVVVTAPRISTDFSGASFSNFSVSDFSSVTPPALPQFNNNTMQDGVEVAVLDKIAVGAVLLCAKSKKCVEGVGKGVKKAAEKYKEHQKKQAKNKEKNEEALSTEPTTISEKVRDIEKRVRDGETSFPLDTKETLDSVADGMADNIKRQLKKGNIDRAKDLTGKMKGAIDKLDRFDALTPEARNGLKSGLDKVLQDGIK